MDAKTERARYSKVFAIFVGVTTFISLFAYFYSFGGWGAELSGVHGDWGSFGSYLGGVLGPLLAFLAYLGVRDQIHNQRKIIDQQRQDKAFEDHLLRIRESFDRLEALTNSAIEPLEAHVGVKLNSALYTELEKAARSAELVHIIDNLIYAAKLLQSAEFVYRYYLHLIDSSAENLNVETALNEHKWVAIVTWRGLEKKSRFISYLMIVAERFAKDNCYDEEYREAVIYNAAFERWEQEWATTNLAF